MDLHVTLVSAAQGGGPPREIVVDTDEVPTGAELGVRLEADGAPPPFTVDGAPLESLTPHSAGLGDGAVILSGKPPGSRDPSTTSAPPLVFVVASGPDAGQVVPLSRGRYTIGREGTDIVVGDPALSREHATLTVTKDSMLLRDEGSANGTFVDGERIGEFPVTGPEALRIGSSRCRVEILDTPTSADPVDARILEPLRVGQDLPVPPPRVLLLTAFLPLLLGVVLAVTTGMWFFLAFSALSAVTGTVPLLTYRRTRKAFTAAVRTAADLDARRRTAAVPDPGRIALEALRATRHPVPRSGGRGRAEPGGMLLRLGTADQEAHLHLDRASDGFAPPVLADLPLLVSTGAPPPSPAGPSAFSGPASGALRVLDLRGEPGQVGALARALLLQLAVTASAPVLVVCWGRVQDLSLHARFLPGIHLTSNRAVFMSLLAQPGVRVVLQFSEELPDLPEASVCGLLLIHVGVRASDDPAVSSDDVVLTARSAVARLGGTRYQLLADGVSLRSFERTARALGRTASARPPGTGPTAPVPGGAGAALPPTASLWGEGLLPPVPASTLGSRWSGADPAHPRARVGISADGPVVLDLAQDGPHLLVAGTTGSGKSEFLRTLVLSLALSQPPEYLTLLLIDYKGGAGLNVLSGLPHCVGTLTDLSTESTGRAITSLRAELRRREQLCADAGVHDLDELRRVVPGTCPPRLVVVIDEFRMLGEEVPTAVPDLMRIASLGRSLGVHLVLATQRAQGAVTPDIRANITSTVLLRVQTRLESQDLLGTAAAAELPVGIPGRAYLRRGTEAPVAFQVASCSEGPSGEVRRGWEDLVDHLDALPPTLSGSPTTSDREVGPSPVARGRTRTAAAPTVRDDHAADRPATILADAVRSIREVGGTDGGAPPRRPVLPPLPADLAPDADLDLVPSDLHSTPFSGPYSGPPDPGIALGVADFPDRQEQRLLCWAPSRHSHLALLGLPGSGAAEAAGAVVGALIHGRPDSHLYLLDGDGSLAQHRGAPQLGALVQHSEPGRAARVLERLAGLPPRAGEDAREIVLVVTGWGRWATRFRGGRFARAEEDLHSLVRDGAQTGVSVLVTGDREVTGARFFALLPNRVYLPRGAHPETTMTWPRMPVLDPVPGRGYVQGRIAGPPGEGVCQLILRRSTAAVATRPPSVLPFPVLPLPRHLPLLELQRTLDAARARGSARDPGPGLLLGVHGDDLLPYSVDLPPGEVHLVLGPPGSGRSNVLRVLARAADRISPRRRVLAPPGETSGVERADFWRALPRGAGPSSEAQQCLLLVDDADRLPADVQQILSGLVAHGAAAVLVASPGPTLTSRVPLALQARASGRGLILMPRSAADGDILGHRPETDAGASPGRGVACGPEGAVEIQVAFASHPAPAPAIPDGSDAAREDVGGPLERPVPVRGPRGEQHHGTGEQRHDHGGRRHQEEEPVERVPRVEVGEGEDHQEHLDHQGG